MSSTLRLSVIMVLLLATAALGMIALNMNRPKMAAQAVAPAVQSAAPPVMTAYFVAAHPLPVGTLARDEDFDVHSALPEDMPSGAIAESPEAKNELRGSLVRKFLETGHVVTSQDILRPRDRGFLASVLAPDTRAISINVDTESGVSGLIWPGDNVDVVLSQNIDKADSARHSLSEIVLRNVRIIAIDQEIVEGVSGANPTAGKLTHTVSLQLTPEQVKKITVAKDLGKLSLAVRSAVQLKEAPDTGAMFGCDVSPEIARQSAIARQSTTVAVYQNGKLTEYAVRKHAAGDASQELGCDASAEMARQNAAFLSPGNEKGKE